MFPKNDSNDLYTIMKDYNKQRINEAENHRLAPRGHNKRRLGLMLLLVALFVVLALASVETTRALYLFYGAFQ